MDNHLDTKDLITATSPLIKSLIDTLVTPKIEKLRNKYHHVQEKNKYLEIPFEKYFSEYYHRSFKKMVIVNTLVFNNSQRFLDEIYVPLTIVNTVNPKEKFKVKSFPSQLSNDYWNILITDTAGMGKSTLMKKLFLDILYNKEGIPIFIELRRLSKKKTIFDELLEQLNSINSHFDKDIILDLLAEGDFIIILDGYDEIPLEDKDIVTTDIQEFIHKTSNNKFFITSRPEKSLLSFGNFQEFRIASLNKDEAFDLLRKYDKNGVNSKLLIKKLEETELSNISEFLTNPLLVSLLFTAFEHKQSIPFKKYIFYRQVYDANFEAHDLTKGDSYTHDKFSKLEIDDFHRVLRHIGFSSLKAQKIEYTKDEILKHIDDAKKFCISLVFNNSDFLNDLLKTVPLFTQDGNYYRWSHKSLQEYFAAQFIYLDAKSKQEIILAKLYKSKNLENYINVLDLYYDMDYKGFRNVIIKDLVDGYLIHNNDFYNDNDPNVESLDVIMRKELTFLYKTYAFISDEMDMAGQFSQSVVDMLSSIDKLKDNINLVHEGILMDAALMNNVYGLQYHDIRISIINLLYSKNNPIAKYIDYEFPEQSININFSFSKDADPILISDSKYEIYNASENFVQTNQFIIHNMLHTFTIDHYEILNMKSLLSENENFENQIDSLLEEL